MNRSRWWYTIRYHRPSQLVWRAVTVIRRRLFPLLPHSSYKGENPSSFSLRRNARFDAIVARQLALRAKCPCRGRAISAGEFEFLNERRTLTSPIDWRLASVEPVSHLWRFHLHYHEFLLDLLAASRTVGRPEMEQRLWAIIDDWIAANPVDRDDALSDAWHPFCISKRIAVWLMIWHASEPPQDLRPRFAASLEGQIRYLERNLEWDLRGNHLLENLRTLALAGAFFEGAVAERRLDRAVKLLQVQLAEQILPSGEHYERSPMYHAQMLNAVLDVRDAVTTVRPDFALRCAEVAQRMGAFLQVVTHADGEVALLADTALSETPNVDVLMAAVQSGNIETRSGAEGRDPSPTAGQPVVVESGGYWRWRHATESILFDAAPVGADELPAHAHCDLLTIEASVGGQRVFVDSGVYDYSDGEMRRYCRSTAAHNVLQIDGIEQCDMWSRFRLGYRGHPTSFESGETDEFSWCRATHDAYRRIGVPTVGRWLACRAGGPWFCMDWAEGKGRHELVSRLHLAPDITATPISSQTVRIEIGDRVLEVRSLTDAPIIVEQGWYCPDFGVQQEAVVLKFASIAALPACFGWMVQDIDLVSCAHLEAEPGGEVALRWQHKGSEMILNPLGMVIA